MAGLGIGYGLDRRAALSIMLGACLAALAAPCCKAHADGGLPTGADDPSVWKNDGTSFKDLMANRWGRGRNPNGLSTIAVLSRRVGCTLSGAVAGKLSAQDFSLTTGDPQMDRAFVNEAWSLARAFGVYPNLGIFNDADGPNAFSSPQDVWGMLPDGCVVFGINLLSQEVSRFGTTAIMGILAHEWGHSQQYKLAGGLGSGKRPELHADFMAGWYCGLKASSLGMSSLDIDSFAKSLYEKGDTHFNSPDHHGTPDERVGAMIAGARSAGMGVARSVDAFRMGLESL